MCDEPADDALDTVLDEERPKIDENMPAFRIAAKFGGVVAFARALGKNPSTCHRWLVSGLIPAKHQATVLQAARDNRIKMKSDDFIPALPDAA